MVLESLSINRRQTWEAGFGAYRGQIKFVNERGSVELTLDDETSRKLLAVVADATVESAKNIATNLTAEVFTQPQLESKP
tara:strand:- start:950 stop:1189 length:240 start_codon:yes stop_codon:yes gene_type:complete